MKFPHNSLLARKNLYPFKGGYPFIRVKTCRDIESGVSKTHRLINGYHIFKPTAVEIISEERADQLENLWNSLTISPASPSEGSHFRTDNGLPKKALAESEWRDILFHYILKSTPDFDVNNLPYEVYVCPECNSLHLGKKSSLLSSAGPDALSSPRISGNS